ncbi:MAG: rod shape-determining protein MreC [Planctomycetota bacterium]
MRLAKIDRVPLVLAALFGLAIVRGRSLPGEDVLPDLFGAVVQGPVRAGAAAGKDGKHKTEALESEVAGLKREIRELRGQVQSARDLRKYFDEMKWPARPRAVHGWVVGIEPDPWQLGFRIRIPGDEGVRLDPENGPRRLAVVNGRALLGVVVSLDNRRLCTVRRVDDGRFQIEVEVEINGQIKHGIAQGTGDETMSLRFTRLAKDLELGTEVFTSAYDRDIPAGLFVGRVEEVTDREKDGVHEVKVVPAASFVRLGQVDVLLPARGR